MPLVIVAGGVALLLLLMIRFKLNGFISLVLVALAVGIAQGMPVDKVIGSIKAGVGGTLGSLALIMGFGAMLGKLLADCGGAQRIATTLIDKFGRKHIQWAVVLTGFTVGFALFYEVGFVLLLPLVFTIAASARIPLLYVGVPMAAALSVTHGFLPPHPGPTAIATIFHAVRHAAGDPDGDPGRPGLCPLPERHRQAGAGRPVQPENLYRSGDAELWRQRRHVAGAGDPDGTARGR